MRRVAVAVGVAAVVSFTTAPHVEACPYFDPADPRNICVPPDDGPNLPLPVNPSPIGPIPTLPPKKPEPKPAPSVPVSTVPPITALPVPAPTTTVPSSSTTSTTSTVVGLIPPATSPPWIEPPAVTDPEPLRPAGATLPATGGDPTVLFVAGVAMLIVGAALRRR